MIVEMLGTNGAKFIVASLVVAFALLCLVGVFWFIRNRPSSPFIRGGKNRQPRLAVLDAAAVDTRRRLVLVRRDDVEHLIMIGGPTDIVIESRIAPQRPATMATPQSVAEPALSQPVVLQPAAERRVVQPQTQALPETRALPETKAAPVSAMANVLYGESPDRPAELPRQVATSMPVRLPRDETSTLPRQASADRLPSQVIPSRENTGGVSAAATPFPASKAPEDILEAARNRVLAAGGVPAQTPAQSRPIQTPVVAIPQQPVEKPRVDFESFLDAEISGDLQKLTPEPLSRPDIAVRPAVTARQEPSLEEEMNRMLGEIASNRKP